MSVFVEQTKCYFFKKLLLWLNMMCIKWMFVEKTVSKCFLKETTVLIECDVYIKCLCLLWKLCTNVLFFKKLQFSLNLQYIFTGGYFQYQLTDCGTENYQSLWRQIHYDVTDKNINISLKVSIYVFTSMIVNF